MKFTLKDYQEEAVKDVLVNLKKASRRWREDKDKHAFSLTATTGAGKKSKAGRLGYKNGKTIASLGQDYDPGDLITVYENGQVVTHYTLEDVRSRAAL